MAVLQRTALYPQERFDIPDARAMEAFGQNDWRFFIKGILTQKSVIISGFDITNYPNIFTVPGVRIQQNNIAFLHPEATTQANGFYVSAGSEPDFNLVLNSNTTNFVEVDLTATSGSPDVRAFWDAGADGGKGAEFTQTVDTVINLELDIQVNVSGFTPGKIPLYKITTNLSGVVTEFQDCRPMFFRLGSGGTSPDPDNNLEFANAPDAAHARLETPFIANQATTGNAPFLGGDKNIKSQKQWMDAVMTLIKETNGTPYWYMKPSASTASAYQNAAMSILTGGTWEHLGKSAKITSKTSNSVTVETGQLFHAGPSTFVYSGTTYNYTTYSSSTGVFSGVSPSASGMVVGNYIHQGSTGHLKLIGGSVLVRLGQSNSTLAAFNDIDLNTNKALFLILSKDGSLNGYGMGDNGTSPIVPKALAAISNNSLTVPTGGNYRTTGGKVMVRGQEFSYSSYDAGTGVFLGVSPDPAGLLKIGDAVYQAANGSTAYYHHAPSSDVPGTIDGMSEGVERVFWLAYYDGNNTIYIRDSELVPGEQAQVGSDDPSQIYQFVGSSGPNDGYPVYNVNTIANGTPLVEAIGAAFSVIETPIYDERITTPAGNPVTTTQGNTTQSNNFQALDSSNSQKIAIPFNVSQPATLDSLMLAMRKNGSATGILNIDIVTSNAGAPTNSTVAPQQTYNFTSDPNTNIIPVNKTYSGVLLNPGLYFIVLSATGGYSPSGPTYFALNYQANHATPNGVYTFNGTTWNSNATAKAYYSVTTTENVASGWPSGTVINLPTNSKTSTPGAYSLGTDELEVYENGILLQKGYDYAELTSSQIQLLRDVYAGAYLRFRIASVGGAGAASGGGPTGTSLQDGYNNGAAIVTVPGTPVVIDGNPGNKLLHVKGDVQIDGVIDPTGLEFDEVSASPLAAGKSGFFVHPTDGLVFVKKTGASTQAPLKISQIVQALSGDSGSLRRSMQNTSGATIPAGSPVYISGNRQIALADADDEGKARFFGITAQTIADGAFGDVIYQGVVPGILQGSGIPAGEYVWLQASPGAMDITPPNTVGTFLVVIGLSDGDDLILQQQTNGRLE
jgi:hypothetical protein